MLFPCGCQLGESDDIAIVFQYGVRRHREAFEILFAVVWDELLAEQHVPPSSLWSSVGIGASPAARLLGNRTSAALGRLGTPAGK